MKGIKYTISFCVIFIGLLIIAESHIFYLENFYTQYNSTTLYLQYDTTKEEMIDDIINSAEHNGVEVFTFIRFQSNIFLTEYNIYGTPGTEKYLNDKSNIVEEKYKSLFMGNINFKFESINNIPNIEKVHDYYVIGSTEQVHKFKMELIEKYAGNHPKPGYPDKESRNNTIVIWALIICIILLLSFYDVVSQKKENVIRISMGEKISKIICINILIDSFIFVVMFIVILFILSRYSYVFFNFNISIIFFAILLCINGLLYLNLYSYDIKEAFSNGKSYKSLLSLNYGLKLITTVLIILIISSNIFSISESLSLYKQKTFFEEHADYYYIKFAYRIRENSDGSFNDTLTDSSRVQVIFNKQFFEKFNAIELKNVSNVYGTGGILANKNAFDYLSSKIDELRDINLEKEFYFLLPEKMKNNLELINLLIDYIEIFESNDYGVIYYNDNIEVVGVDEDSLYGSDVVKNPIIVYNNMSLEQLKLQSDNNEQNIMKSEQLYDTMYKISSNDDLKEFNKFIVEYNLQDEIVNKTNVLEKYENSWIIAKRILYINLVFSILVLLLELIIINSIIRLEYEVNAIELSIKKVMGYSVLEKNWKIIMMTVITTISSILIAIIGARIMQIQEVYYIAFGGSIILILELFIIVFYINRIENSKIQKILKGGNL